MEGDRHRPNDEVRTQSWHRGAQLQGGSFVRLITRIFSIRTPRSNLQIKSHAQKVLNKANSAQRRAEEGEPVGRAASNSIFRELELAEADGRLPRSPDNKSLSRDKQQQRPQGNLVPTEPATTTLSPGSSLPPPNNDENSNAAHYLSRHQSHPSFARENPPSDAWRGYADDTLSSSTPLSTSVVSRSAVERNVEVRGIPTDCCPGGGGDDDDDALQAARALCLLGQDRL